MHYTRWQRHGDPLYVVPRPRNPRPECKVIGCSRPAHGYGMCVMHHKRWAKYGDPEMGSRVVRCDGPCSVEGCGKAVKSNDLCRWHYEKSRRYGDPLAAAPQRPAKRYRMVSAPGHPLAGNGRLILLHRKVLFDRIGPGWHHCYWCGRLVEWRAGRPSGDALVVDHIDHDMQNNTPENLVPSCNPCNGHRPRDGSWHPWQPECRSA